MKHAQGQQDHALCGMAFDAFESNAAFTVTVLALSASPSANSFFEAFSNIDAVNASVVVFSAFVLSPAIKSSLLAFVVNPLFNSNELAFVAKFIAN